MLKIGENIDAAWRAILQTEFEKDYFAKLSAFVEKEYETKQVFPPQNQIYYAFEQCKFDAIKVVILGQDPYHELGQAHGLCFSVNDGVNFPPSLKNIFKEIERDLAIAKPTSGNLTAWANQGVLLLNATLTVAEHKAGSHQKKGWETFTDAIIRKIADEKQDVVFMLWGNYAQQKASMIDESKHLVLKSVHPSPLSAYRGFIGCGHFSTANQFLLKKGRDEIYW